MESTVPLSSTVEDLPVEVFELTGDGVEVESLTGVASFSGRTGCCCHAISTTCTSTTSCLCFC